jgi:hypothetical protein
VTTVLERPASSVAGPAPRAWSRIGGLDGLRAIAVTAVAPTTSATSGSPEASSGSTSSSSSAASSSPPCCSPSSWLLATRPLVVLAAVAVSLGALVGLLATAPTAEQVAAGAGLGRTTEVVDSGRARTSVRPVVAARQTGAPTRATSPEAPATPATRAPAPYSGALADGVGPADRPLQDGVRLTSADISWYGSSVDLWAVATLRTVVPGVAIDAGINRAPGSVEGRAVRDLGARRLRKAVVLHLGDAGPVSAAALDRTLSRLDSRVRVVLVNSTARFAFVAPGNRTLAQVARDHPNVVVADWTSYSASHPERFKDGLHLTVRGMPYYALFVRRAMLGV